MKKTLLILVLGLCTLWVQAQRNGKVIIAEESAIDKDSLVDSYLKNMNTYIKVSLTDYFLFEPVYGLSYSMPMNEGFNRLDLGLGYVTYNKSLHALDWGFDAPISYHGVKAQAEYRKYFMSKGKERAIRKDYGPLFKDYVAFNFAYKYGNSWYEKEFSRLDGQYWETMGLLAHKHIISAQIMLGGESKLFSKSSSILEWYCGMGFRYKYISSKEENINQEDYSPFFYDDLNSPFMVTASIGLKLGFQIK